MSDFVAYCSEGSASGARLCSVGCVSLPAEAQAGFATDLAAAVADAAAGESPGIRLVGASLGGLVRGVRIDVLMWDAHEPRNFTEPRGDASDLETMCYHLLTNALRTRPDGSGWQLRFGRKAFARWPTLSDCTGSTTRTGPPERLLFVDFARKASHLVHDASEADPGGSVELQLAGLFAALGTFSRQRHDRFETWCRLAADERGSTGFDATEAANFGLIAHLSAEAKKAKLGISLSSSQGLRTRDGRRPLNFWWYEPATR